MVGQHNQLNTYAFELTLGDSEGQGSLVCCSQLGHKELNTTQQLNNNNQIDANDLTCYVFFQEFYSFKSYVQVCSPFLINS